MPDAPINDLAIRRRGRTTDLTPEQRKQRHAQYMKQYYEDHKNTMRENARRSYMRRRPQPAPEVAAQ